MKNKRKNRRANGEGSIFYNPKRENYTAQFQYIDPKSGIYKLKRLSARTKSAALLRMKEFVKKTELERKDFLENQQLEATVSTWLYEWLEKYIKPTVRIKSYERNLCAIKSHICPYIGDIPLSKLDTDTIQDMLNDLLECGGKNKRGLAPRTINTTRTVLKAGLNKACELHLIENNPAKATKPFATDKATIHVLTKEEAKELLRVAYHDKSGYIAIVIALTTGMRIGEIFGLEWNAIDLDTKRLYIKQELVTTNSGMKLEPTTKNGHYRHVILTDFCIKKIQEYYDYQKKHIELFDDKYHNKNIVISTLNGKWRDPNRFSYVTFKELLREAGIVGSVRFHDLRHTHATWLLEESVNPKIVSERLGHSTVKLTLDTYSHIINSLQQEAVIKLNSLCEKW